LIDGKYNTEAQNEGKEGRRNRPEADIQKKRTDDENVK
jgi:hypothetical protein